MRTKILGLQLHPVMLGLVIAEFALAAVAFLVSAAVVTTGALELAGTPSVPGALGFGTTVVLGFTAMGLYEPRHRFRREGILMRLALGLAFAVLCTWVLGLIYPDEVDPAVWAASFALGFVMLAGSRSAFDKLVDQRAFKANVLVFGAGERASRLLRLRRRADQRGFQIVAFLPAPGDVMLINDPRVAATEKSLIDYVRENDINEIVVAMDERRAGFPIEDLLKCRFEGIMVTDLVAFLERETGKVDVNLVNPSWLIFSDGFTMHRRRQIVGRIFDLVIGTCALVVALPLMALVALAILLEDGAPVLYRQRRVGRNHEIFTVLKFRSMIKDAEADGQARFADENDARITRVGAALRKLRLDELPQILNVLLGDMSIVGPRPERPEFVEGLSERVPFYDERHIVKPGITGWAQLRYKYASTEEDTIEKLQYDLFYVKHQGVIFDLMVLLQTVEVVLWGKGAR